jgi:regulation of enolase protein 1 (concanavalin A-like superfamily)
MPFKTHTQLCLSGATALVCGASFAQVPAFPGAVGFGANATGGRAGTIVHVTNLNDSGPGSFRDAVSAPNRIVVFDVGGYIVLTSPVSVYGNITIEGQTAPGDGIGIMAGEVSLSNKSNIIVRGLRVRQGRKDPLRGKSALGMSNASNIVLDHCSFEYGQWDSIDAVKTSNFTVQDSVIANPIGQQFGAHVEGGPSTFWRNLWVSAHNRQPLSKDNTQFINNVIYDYQAGYTVGNTGGYFSHDIVNNYFIAGPRTTSVNNAFFQMNNKQSVYAAGNFLDADRDGTLNGSAYNTAGSSLVLASPWANTTNALATLSAADAFASVTASAGAWPRDAVDQFAVDAALSLGTSGDLYKDQAATGLPNEGYGILNSGSPQPDTNGDGIPDYWARANGISTIDAAAAAAPFGASGYLNIEAYANSLVLPDTWTAQDIGGPSLSGASTYNALTQAWVLTGSGSNPAGGFDQAQFASRPWTAQHSITARLDALASGQAGLMIRNGSGAQVAFVALVLDSDGTLRLVWRHKDGASAHSMQRTGFGRATWLRLEQRGAALLAYTSVDGSSWRPFSAAQAKLSSTARAGLAVASDDPNVRAAATFTHLALSANEQHAATAHR